MKPRAKDISPKELDHINYNLNIISKSKLIILAGMILFLAFLFHFPLKEVINKNLRTVLAGLPNCSVQYRDMNFEMLLPKVVLSKVELPGSCFSPGSSGLNFKTLKIHFNGLSFSPLGLATMTEGKIFKKSKIEIRQALGITNQVIKIEENKYPLSEILKFANSKILLSGDISIAAQVGINSGKVGESMFKVKSRNLYFPSQTMMFLTLPALELNDVSLKGRMKSANRIHFEEIIIGDTNSPLRANFKGDISPNPVNFINSIIDLKGEIAVSPKLLGELPLLKPILEQFPQKDGFYQIGLKGTIGQVQPVSI